MGEFNNINPVKWENGRITWINQTKIPWSEEWKNTSGVEELARSIEALEIRGAPLIGIAAAYGMVLSAFNIPSESDTALAKDEMISSIRLGYERLKRTRPTAMNLFWALDRMLSKALYLTNEELSVDEIKEGLLKEAKSIEAEEIESDKAIGRAGNLLIKENDVILTHCNTGSLATGGIGTACGIIRTAWEAGKKIKVIVTYTAPLYQGARLTMWELERSGIPATLITDNMAAYAINDRKVSMVIVGADRILLNGNTANKVGTYGLAILAKYHGIPFYVAAPSSTIDSVNKSIQVEQRGPGEVRIIEGRLPITVPNADVLNPAFDITPHDLIKAIITEHNVAIEPYNASLSEAVAKSKRLVQ